MGLRELSPPVTRPPALPRARPRTAAVTAKTFPSTPSRGSLRCWGFRTSAHRPPSASGPAPGAEAPRAAGQAGGQREARRAGPTSPRGTRGQGLGPGHAHPTFWLESLKETRSSTRHGAPLACHPDSHTTKSVNVAYGSALSRTADGVCCPQVCRLEQNAPKETATQRDAQERDTRTGHVCSYGWGRQPRSLTADQLGAQHPGRAESTQHGAQHPGCAEYPTRCPASQTHRAPNMAPSTPDTQST